MNEITSQNGVNRTLTYDLNGSITSDCCTRTFEWPARSAFLQAGKDKTIAGRQWDGANRLVAINYTGFTTRSEFAYDGLNRIAKIVEKTGATINSTRKFVWNGQEKLELRDATNAVTQRNYSQGQYVGTTAYFYTRDHLGSIREMFTGGGTVVARYDYDPYGRSTTVLGTTPTDFNFTGLYRHSKSNLDLAVYRAYDPDLGRWLSRDPIGENGGLNLYGYVGNNSANLTDPLGLLVEVYYEGIGSGPGGRTAAAIARAKHSYVHVQTRSIDVTLEMEGPHVGRPYGNVTIRDFDPNRGGTRRDVTRHCPDDDYSLEYNILDEFFKYYDDRLRLPDYDGPSQNSNTFANYLISSQGGSIQNIPWTAYGSGNAFVPNRTFRLETVAPEVISRNAFGDMHF